MSHKIRFCVVTSDEDGGAAAALEHLRNQCRSNLVCVILQTSAPPITWKRFRHRLRKIAKIGPIAAYFGRRRRAWFHHSVKRNLRQEAQRLGVPVFCVDAINSTDTIAFIEHNDINLGVSLGNSYIERRVFETPKLGFINYHGELLPKYAGAQSIIWPIHEGETQSGFSIHRVSGKIDGGDILLKRSFPIVFRSTLKETVRVTGQSIHPHMPAAIAHVIDNFEQLANTAEDNAHTGSFTTPTLRQYYRMVRNNKKFWRASRRVGTSMQGQIQ